MHIVQKHLCAGCALVCGATRTVCSIKSAQEMTWGHSAPEENYHLPLVGSRLRCNLLFLTPPPPPNFCFPVTFILNVVPVIKVIVRKRFSFLLNFTSFLLGFTQFCFPTCSVLPNTLRLAPLLFF